MTVALLLALQLRVAAAALPVPPTTDPWFGSDKLKHFLLAGFVQGFAYATARSLELRHGRAQAGALVVSIGLSVEKERRDRRTSGRFSIRDLAWSVGGAAASAALLSRTAR